MHFGVNISHLRWNWKASPSPSTFVYQSWLRWTNNSWFSVCEIAFVQFAVNISHLRWNRIASPSPSSIGLAKLASVNKQFLFFSLWDHLFFHWRFSFWTLCALGLPLFSSEVFLLSPLHFGVASFFIGGFSFEPLAFWGCLLISLLLL
jgi:hypothetical protein